MDISYLLTSDESPYYNPKCLVCNVDTFQWSNGPIQFVYLSFLLEPLLLLWPSSKQLYQTHCMMNATEYSKLVHLKRICDILIYQWWLKQSFFCIYPISECCFCHLYWSLHFYHNRLCQRWFLLLVEKCQCFWRM